jgi:hypothetical protein
LPVTFAGVEGERAARVVYALDASGAMTSTLPWIKREVALSVARLASSQSFEVVVFRVEPGGSPRIERFADDPTPATESAKLALARWLRGIEPSGRSDPLAGLTAALRHDPELVYLLTRSIRRSAGDDWGAGLKPTLDALERLNPRARDGTRRAVIKSVAFLEEDLTGLLDAIAQRHGDGPGSARVIPLEALRDDAR